MIFYHSSVNPPSAVGVVKVGSGAYPDTTAMDPKDDHFDPKSTEENPIWMQVDMVFVEKFKNPVSISLIKANPRLNGVPVTQVGNRLSIQPLLEKHFEEICRMSTSVGEEDTGAMTCGGSTELIRANVTV